MHPDIFSAALLLLHKGFGIPGFLIQAHLVLFFSASVFLFPLSLSEGPAQNFQAGSVPASAVPYLYEAAVRGGYLPLAAFCIFPAVLRSLPVLYEAVPEPDIFLAAPVFLGSEAPALRIFYLYLYIFLLLLKSSQVPEELSQAVSLQTLFSAPGFVSVQKNAASFPLHEASDPLPVPVSEALLPCFLPHQ